MAKIYVSAKITAKPGLADQVEKALLEVIPVVRQEKGCLKYDLHRSQDGSPTLLFYEIWASDEDLAAHAASAHMKAMRSSMKDLVAGPSEVSTWRAVDVT